MRNGYTSEQWRYSTLPRFIVLVVPALAILIRTLWFYSALQSAFPIKLVKKHMLNEQKPIWQFIIEYHIKMKINFIVEGFIWKRLFFSIQYFEITHLCVVFFIFILRLVCFFIKHKKKLHFLKKILIVLHTKK